MSFDTDSGGKHTVTLKVSLTHGTTYTVKKELHGSISRDTAVARAAANVSREMRLGEWHEVSFVSHQWDAFDN